MLVDKTGLIISLVALFRHADHHHDRSHRSNPQRPAHVVCTCARVYVCVMCAHSGRAHGVTRGARACVCVCDLRMWRGPSPPAGNLPELLTRFRRQANTAALVDHIQKNIRQEHDLSFEFRSVPSLRFHDLFRDLSLS